MSPRSRDKTERTIPSHNRFHENEAESGRTEAQEEIDMKYRREMVTEQGWDGEFGTYDEWARLGPQPPYRSATFLDTQGRRCVTQQDFSRARDTNAFPVRFRWETTKARKCCYSGRLDQVNGTRSPIFGVCWTRSKSGEPSPPPDPSGPRPHRRRVAIH